LLGATGLADAADEEGDVGALAAAVGVELVEDEEAEALRGALDEALSSGGSGSARASRSW
jgi:hypothetical protein